jgi:hypothetical protein
MQKVRDTEMVFIGFAPPAKRSTLSAIKDRFLLFVCYVLRPDKIYLHLTIAFLKSCFNMRAGDVIIPIGIECAKDRQVSEIKVVGIDLALKSIHFFALTLYNEVYLPARFVSPIKYLFVSMNDVQGIENKVLPEKPPVILPDAVPTLNKGHKTCIKGIALRSVSDFSASTSVKR